ERPAHVAALRQRVVALEEGAPAVGEPQPEGRRRRVAAVDAPRRHDRRAEQRARARPHGGRHLPPEGLRLPQHPLHRVDRPRSLSPTAPTDRHHGARPPVSSTAADAAGPAGAASATRPRRWSGVSSWLLVPRRTALTMFPRPVPASIATESQSVLESAKPTVPSAKSTAAASRTDGEVRPSRLSSARPPATRPVPTWPA